MPSRQVIPVIIPLYYNIAFQKKHYNLPNFAKKIQKNLPLVRRNFHALEQNTRKMSLIVETVLNPRRKENTDERLREFGSTQY